MKSIVYYYSGKGNNKFLAKKIAESLNCPAEELKPVLNSLPMFMMGINPGLKRLKQMPPEYDRIILCGPIWAGRLIPPLKAFLKGYRRHIVSLIFVSCCGTSFEQKDEKFGHEHVFTIVKNIMGEKCKACQAIPISLVLNPEDRENPQMVMDTRLNEDNFTGKIREVFDNFMEELNA